MQPLATQVDLSVRGLTATDANLEAASAAIRDAAGVPISLEAGTVTVMGTMAEWLPLPAPVISVSEVIIDGSAVTDYQVWPHALYRLGGWANCEEWRHHRVTVPTPVQVTMTYGYTTIPADIVSLACNLAVMDAAGPVDPRISSVSIDDGAVTTAQDAAPSALELPERTRLALRNRFGGATIFAVGQS